MESQNRKDQILSTAYEIAGKAGLENLHARTIGAELGINHAAVHYYFAKRIDLLIALCEYSLKRFEGDLERVCSNRTTATQRLEAHIALYEAYARPTSRFFRVLASLFVASAAEAELKAKLVHVQTVQMERLRDHLTAAVAEGGVNQGSIFTDVDALAGYLNGLCYRSQMLGGMDPTAMIDALYASLFRR